jgi:glycosyltransferase involved in cell wall biosynthesis
MSQTLLDLRGLNYPFLTGINTVTLHILNEICDNPELLSKVNFSIFGVNHNKIKDLSQEFSWLKKLLADPSANLDRNLNHPRLKQALYISKFYLNQTHRAWQKFDTIYQTQPKPIPKLFKNQKLITTFHDLSSIKNLNQPSFKHFIQENRLAYEKLTTQASQIITCSYATAYDLVRSLKVPENKIKVIYQALPDWDRLYSKNDTEIEVKTQLKSGRPYFLAISAFEYRKNYHNLILAWHNMRQNEPSIYENYELIIAGNKVDQSYFNYLENLISRLELSNIRLECDVDTQNKETLLANCLALIYTSLYEGFGFPILEAQKYGKAILTSNVSSMPEIAGQGALLVSPLDSFQICEGMTILAKDQQYRENLAQAGVENLKRFSWDEYGRALNEIFKV